MELIRGAELLEHLAAAELQQTFLDVQMATEHRHAIDPDQTLAVRPRKAAALSSIYAGHVYETFRQIAVAIAVLHAHGIVHRDIKPPNILITPQGRVVLLDFGLVVKSDLEDSIDRATVVGTPGYMSPEQVTAAPITPATDWYSFGVLLYQALTGRLPFRGANALEMMENQLRGELPPLASRVVSGVPEDLAALAAACLERDAAQRPRGAEVLGRLGITDFDPLQIERMRERSGTVIGRRRELRTLRRYVDGVKAGQSRMVLLHGSPGVGKSTLADQLLDHLRSETNAFILGGHCRPWESLPLNAADAIVDSLARELRRGRNAAVNHAMARAVAVTQVFPLLGGAMTEDIADQTVSVPQSGEKLFARALSELRSILHATSEGRPVVMLLDDAQWGDYQSALVFRSLLRATNDHPTVLILCYRTEDWQTSLLLQALRGDEMDTREVEVKALSRPMIAQLVRQRAPRASKALVDRLFRESGGNPLLAQMVSDHTSLRRAIQQRLSDLSTPARSLFNFILEADGPVAEPEAARSLELFEINEPLRSLASRQLIRVRKTGDLAELEIYHPRMRGSRVAGT
jgi:Cdc6-like AAA superfamily ATPase